MKKGKGFLMLVSLFLCGILIFTSICTMDVFTMKADAASVGLNYKKAELGKGQTVQLKVEGTKKSVKWSSDNKSVATVSSKGLVQAESTGKATITATVGKKKYRCKVTVTKKEQLYIPSYAVMSGDVVYFAIGPDGGGCLYAYNTSKKAKKLISKMQCSEISEKGNYLYCTVNKYGGSDGRNKYIYKIAKNGKSSKKLANGFCPIIIDNYIYYIGVKKEKLSWSGSGYVDVSNIGIYRMTLDGKNKKCIYQFDSSSNAGGMYANKLIGGNDKIIFCNDYGDDNYYSISLDGKNKKVYKVSTGKLKLNTTLYRLQTTYFWGDIWLDKASISSNTSGYSYTASGNNIYRKSGSTKKKICSFNKNLTVKKIVDCNEYLFVIADASDGAKVYVYLMTKSGKKVKRVFTTYDVGGGW